jgi:uncharacterized protein (DUF1778 family)
VADENKQESRASFIVEALLMLDSATSERQEQFILNKEDMSSVMHSEALETVYHMQHKRTSDHLY